MLGTPSFDPALQHGQGAYARRRLPQGNCIGVYEGRRYTAEAFLSVDWSPRLAGLTYLLGLYDGATIEGAEGATPRASGTTLASLTALRRK